MIWPTEGKHVKVEEKIKMAVYTNFCCWKEGQTEEMSIHWDERDVDY